jgi:uncharacterized protein (DUF1800 family)
MPAARVKIAVLLFSIALPSTVQPLLAKKKQNATPPSGAGDRKRALHALNRLSFGPRPGDVQRVMAIGVEQWIDLQLHPERIDDSALNSRLQPFRTLRMSTKELAENFPDGQEINQVRNGKRPLPSDAALRMVYQVQIARQQEKKERVQEAKNSAPVESDSAGKAVAAMEPTVSAAKLAPEEGDQARRREQAPYADLDVQQLATLPADQRFKKILGMSTDDQLEVADSLRHGKGQELLEGLSPKEKETLLAMNNPAGVVTAELAQAKLLRAIYSECQLEEVMTDFWFNHFNVFIDKGVDRLLVTSYERNVIRPHALGKFEDLLVATAKSPAMLFYLDNWMSVGPDSPQALGLPPHSGGQYGTAVRSRPIAGKRRNGLNENYGRELLELHTLSVNGGYSQRDVTETAKVFTGWTIDKPFQGGAFKFDARMHEPGPKSVLGHRIKPKGEAEGLELLHKLATSPRTAHFVSLKLAERFVSDDPPPALVDRLTKAFLKKKGDIRDVLTVLFRSPEFWNDGAYRAKVKTPLEFVASSVRATDADVGEAGGLVRQLNNMGMPLYGAQPPTGYSMKAEAWVSSSALLTRMNFALALTSGRIKDVKVDAVQLAQTDAAMDSNLALSTLEHVLLDGDVSKQTHDSIAAQIDASRANAAGTKQDNKATTRNPAEATRPQDVSTIAGLLLGSPEFQRR